MERSHLVNAHAGGMPLVRWDVGILNYLHQDHLGTSVAATLTNGNVVWRETYTPYGELLQGANYNRNRQGFTGHIRDTDTGLTYMQARYYDPVIGRFLSNDPVGFAEGGVDYFNRYSYTANDPVNATDPTGKDIEEIRDSTDENFDLAKAASEATGTEGEAGSGLTSATNNNIINATGFSRRTSRRQGGGRKTVSGGVKRNSLLARIFGSKRFSNTCCETQGNSKDETLGRMGAPGAGPKDGGGSAINGIIIETIVTRGNFTDDSHFGSSGFDNFVSNVTNAAQSRSTSKGRVIALVAINDGSNPLSPTPGSRRFVITPKGQ